MCSRRLLRRPLSRRQRPKRLHLPKWRLLLLPNLRPPKRSRHSMHRQPRRLRPLRRQRALRWAALHRSMPMNRWKPCPCLRLRASSKRARWSLTIWRRHRLPNLLLLPHRRPLRLPPALPARRRLLLRLLRLLRLPKPHHRNSQPRPRRSSHRLRPKCPQWFRPRPRLRCRFRCPWRTTKPSSDFSARSLGSKRALPIRMQPCAAYSTCSLTGWSVIRRAHRLRRATGLPDQPTLA